MAEMIHMGRTQQRVAGPTAELGDTEQVAWCTEEPVEAPDTTTRLINLATCARCIAIWNDSVPYYAQVSLVEDLEPEDALTPAEHERIIAEGPLISREALDEGMRGM